MRTIMRGVVLYLAAIAVTPALAGSSAERGREVFWRRCVTCHAIGCNRGWTPKLEGVIGRKAGTLPGIPGYSDAIKNSGITWSEETLDRFLTDPPAMIPGIRGMTDSDIGIVRDEQERKDLIAFIKSGDTSYDICPG